MSLKQLHHIAVVFSRASCKLGKQWYVHEKLTFLFGEGRTSEFWSALNRRGLPSTSPPARTDFSLLDSWVTCLNESSLQGPRPGEQKWPPCLDINLITYWDLASPIFWGFGLLPCNQISGIFEGWHCGWHLFEGGFQLGRVCTEEFSRRKNKLSSYHHPSDLFPRSHSAGSFAIQLRIFALVMNAS
jgi:hypothetical protein